MIQPSAQPCVALERVIPTTPIGTRCLYVNGLRQAFITATRSEPWQLPHGEWTVLIHGRHGGYDLEHLWVLP